MSKTTCTNVPEVNGQDSKLYKDLLKSNKSKRPFVNWIYACYLAYDIGNQMDAAGYKRNDQGQHKADDVRKYLKIYEMEREFSSLSQEEKNIGAVDANNNRVDFTDANQALRIADNFNETHKGLVATVYAKGNVYNIVLHEKNSRTHMYPTEIKEKLQVWNTISQAFSNNGIDLDSLPKEVKDVINPYQSGVIRYIKGLHNTQINNLFKQSALVLFYLNRNSPYVQRVENAFGTLEDAAQAIDDINNHNGAHVLYNHRRLLLNAVNNATKFNGIDLNALETQVKQISDQVKTSSPEESIRQELHSLNKKYKIEINESRVLSDKISRLSDAANQVVINLERQVREIEKQEGETKESKNLNDIKNQLLNEIQNKKYSAGILNYLNTVSQQLGYDPNTQSSIIDSMIANTPQTGTVIEKTFSMAKTLQDIKKLYEKYYPLVSALADEHITIDEAISQIDIDNIRQASLQLYNHLKNKAEVIRGIEEQTLVELLTEIIGDKAPDGQTILSLVRSAQVDSTLLDFLYSVGRTTNPIIGAMGHIIRKAQDSRDTVMKGIGLRIRRATDKLHKAKKEKSSAMYADDGHIVSDIDWASYNAAKKTEIKRLRKQHLSQWDFTQALKTWEENNTEERVVDVNNGRTERVPNANYRNNLATWDSVNNKMIFHNGWSQAMQDYYNEMMQIKGEIGSMLPSYAQQHYIPPQVRRSTLDAISEAKSAWDVWKALKNKFQNFYKIREDDTNYNINGKVKKRVIDGEEYTVVDSDYDNTPLREIPIFFINPVEEGELLKEFSTGLTALAGTAVNYAAMENIADVVEFIGDFVKTQDSRNSKPNVDQSGNDVILLTYDLNSWGKKNSNTHNLVNGFIAQHIFGQKLDPDQYGYAWSKAVTNLIGYTSFKGLTTNVKGAFSNYLVGEFQMMIEAGAGEFYGFKNFLKAHQRLFGDAGVKGEISDLLTNNMNSKATLFRELFDPVNENFQKASHTKYYNSMFRQLMSCDCSFIGYASGEFLIHYVNMYAILDNKKVKLNGKTISLYEAFEKTPKQDGNSELVLKQGVTTVNGEPLVMGDKFTQEWLDTVKRKIRYANQTTHGSMNSEDKGLIHQNLMGRAVMNFRQWMVEHYSRRFRGMHFDATLEEMREGYWVSFAKFLASDEVKDTWANGKKVDAVLQLMKDFVTFNFRAQAQWDNLNDMQKANVRRVRSEMLMYIALLGLAFVLGEPEEHKKEVWRRWWIYQVKRLILDTEGGSPIAFARIGEGFPIPIPIPLYHMIKSNTTIIQSPVAGVNTLNSLLYIFGGLLNGDITDEIKSGPHKGENRYWRNVKKYALPVFKDWEQMQNMSEDESIFQVFKDTPSNY